MPHLRPAWAELENSAEFLPRHIGPSEEDTKVMLETLQVNSLEDLVASAVPINIMNSKELDLGNPVSEAVMLKRARELANQNQVLKSYIGMGYYGTLTPAVILRNVIENPGWYTAYTPYQAEISQGRLEAILNFQTLISDMTALPIANASLLDEGTAAAEAMHLCYTARSSSAKKNARTILVSRECQPQTIEVLERRAEPLGLHVKLIEHDEFIFDDTVFAVMVQYPQSTGRICDYSEIASAAHAAHVMVIAATDLLALTIIKPPGEWGADIAVGSAQRFGVPLGFGGPHAGFLATRDEFKRSMPGRLVGVSIDAYERPALRLALQTREQHIRREKATSNICTAQVLLAVMASMYAIYHGPKGLKRIAERTHRLATIFAAGLKQMNLFVMEGPFFDTVRVMLPQGAAAAVLEKARNAGYNLRLIDENSLGVSFDETSTRDDLTQLWLVFSSAETQKGNTAGSPGSTIVATTATAATAATTAASATHLIKFDHLHNQHERLQEITPENIPASLLRTTSYLTHPTFTSYHSETEMLRYMARLQAKDLSLTHSMIALGSCTMKLNATSEMIPVTWPEFNQLHPFIPMSQAKGSLTMIHELEGMLAEITGFAAVSLQPNAGSAGEYAGLLAIRDYHKSRNNSHRNICLIPSSAHGTNPASATMAGMKVIVVQCDQGGNVDLADLSQKAESNKENLAALMITYPSTHGVFEEGIREICQIVHNNGGQVYMDGANFNALVGLCRPADFGPDVMHMNLHKTFCIPHGGGGPGVGPIGVREHLKAFLPGHRLTGSSTGLRHIEPSAVASAPYGSASILPISWAYIKMMGRSGLKRATQVAILNANYIAARLDPHYPVLYKGKNGRVAHECIIDCRPLKSTSGVEVEDIAKRLMDYGFHAPTMSWPVAGTLMIEPTESESKAELDRFCEAMIAIRNEIREIEAGKMARENNALKRAPHTVFEISADEWDRPYSREQAAFPLSWVRERKFWPSVARINNPYGDKNLVCSCSPLDAYSKEGK
jgi:glycine dehydrogenase